MLRFILLSVVFVMTASNALAVEKIILDTDLGSDCDDAGTFAVMHNLADRGEIEILAVGLVNGHENAVPCADAINRWFGRPGIPIGTIKQKPPLSRDNYLAAIVKEYPHTLTKAAAPEVVGLYRKVLAAAEDRSVTLVVIGAPTNISNLLNSPADEISPLNGVELMRRKIKLYAAGGNGRGNLPSGMAGWNYQDDLKAAAAEMAKLPTEFPTVFAGGSGNKIEPGNCYLKVPADHIIRRCYEAYLKKKDDLHRPSWDQLRMIYAARPSWRERFTVSPPGDITVEGKNIIWRESPNRNRAYAYVKDPAAMLGELEWLMAHMPAAGAATVPSTGPVHVND